MVWSIIYIFILMLGLITGLTKLRQINNSSKVFLLLLLLTLVAELTGKTLAFYGKSNFIVYHLFTPIQCCLVFLGYYYDMRNKLFIYFMPVIILIATVLSIFVQQPPNFNSYFMEIELLLFSLLNINYFRELLKIEKEVKLKDYPLFWISSGLLIFSVSNIFIMGAYNFFIKSNITSSSTLNYFFLYTRLFSNYIYYSSFIIAFLVKQNTISDQHGK